MSQFLEEIKSRLEDAQKRFQATAQALQAAQQQHQAVSQEVGSLQYLLQVETRKTQGADATTTDSPQAIRTIHTAIASADRGEVNKTELVRDALRQHPNGLLAVDIWKSVSGQIKHRPYFYSILKRLRDEGEVLQRRSKYILKISAKPEEDKEQAGMVQ
jgi:hypothetical protein